MRRAGGTALLLGLAVLTAPAPAQARSTGIVVQGRVAASWGANGNGQLGNGTTADRAHYGDIAIGNDVVQVAAGDTHALALRSDGSVWAWGDNSSGELGDGTTTRRTTPVQVTGLTGVTQVAAGVVVSLALRSDGTVWAWGRNDVGQLGRGTVTDHETTPGRVAVLNNVTQISAGGDFALVLRADGIVFAWGLGSAGQLGTGTLANSSKPVKVPGLSQVRRIAAGWDSAAATEGSPVSAVTSVWTWGANGDGQLGDGTTTGHAVPERVTGIPASIADISIGIKDVMILGADGSVWGWGANGLGELAVAGVGVVTRPVNAIAAGSRIIQLAVGGRHVLALRSDGTVLAWGGGGFGQLGNDSTVSRSGPVPVAGLAGATQVAAGFIASYAVHTVPYLVGL